MPVTVQWGNTEKNILLFKCVGDITIDDYLHIIDHSFNMVTSVTNIVHVIYDRTEVTSVPQHLSRVLFYGSKHITSNLGIVVIVGATPGTMINLQFCQMLFPNFAQRLRFADSQAEARQIIQSYIDART